MKKYIVIGAGILGASTGYHLAKAGVEVTIIDRKDIGQATAAAAGIICPWLTQRRNKAWYRLVKAGARYYPFLIEALKQDGQTNTGYKQVGAISLHNIDEKLDQLEDRAYARLEDAPEIGQITRLSASETKALFPPVADGYGSVHISGGARVNGLELRNALINAAINYGATFIQGDATLALSQDRVIGVKLKEKVIEADQVIITTGAWSGEILKALDLNFLVSPQKAQILHLEYSSMNTSDWPVVMPPNNQYILSFDNGKIILGATHEDEQGFDNRVTAGGVNEILSKGLEIAPGLANCTIKDVKVGFRPFTPGFLPVIGQIPNYQGILVANGLGASGLTAGPYLGAQLAKLALGQELELDLTEYSILTAISNEP